MANFISVELLLFLHLQGCGGFHKDVGLSNGLGMIPKH